MRKTEDFYSASVKYASQGQIKEAELAYNRALRSCNGFPPMFDDKGFSSSLFFRMARLRKVLDKLDKGL